MPSKSFKLLVSSIGLAQASFDTIAGYIPGSQVTDHNAIDLDQLAFENIIDDSTNVNRWAEGYAVYHGGGNSRPQVTLTLDSTERGTSPTNVAIASGTYIYQTVAGVVAAVRTRTTTALGGTSVGPIRYTISDNQAAYVACRGQGAVSATSSTLDTAAQPVTGGCLTTSDTICVNPTLPARTPTEVNSCTGGQTLTVAAVTHSNARTIRGFTGVAGSSGASYPGYRSMAPTTPTYTCPGCPYKDFLWFYQYYGDLAYGDTITMAALGNSGSSWAGTDVTWTAGTPAAANFPVTMSGATASARAEVATKSTNYLTILMYSIREFEDAIDDCTIGSITSNDEPVHAWDEGVAFYTGSLEGESGTRGRGTSPAGVLIWNLADYRCQNFNTCASGTSGLSNVNQNLLVLFARGATTLQRGECSAVRPIIEDLINQMRVPLIQGTLRYVYRVNLLPNSCSDMPKCYAEGGTFAAGVLPVVHYCSPTAAATIAASINLGAGTAAGASYGYVDFPAVKAAFESVYGCMNITCADVGGLYDSGVGGYYAGAEPCTDPAPPAAPPLAPPLEAEEVIPDWAIAIIAAIGALFLFIGLCFCYVIQMEKAGKPLFVSMPKGSSSNAAV